ncbi:MAG TPA: GGDEF domain-containing protein [Actinomycetota bacterium]|nr:GGDEF domain-containing protein [Actinomycetota bacterium]
MDVGRDLCPSTAFRDAVASMLDGLPARTGLGTWMLLRLDDDGGSAVLAVRDPAYGIAADQVLAEDELPVRALLDGRGPRVAPDAAAVPAYAGAVLGRTPVGALAGVPVLAPDGSVFGCLVGADPAPGRPELAAELPTIELLGRLLAVLLVQELERQELQRRFELAELDALTDPLTGVGNRRAWDRLLEAEEARCQRYGSVASLVAIDLDELKRVNDRDGHAAGDRLLLRTAQVIDSTRRAADVVARLGGDEFGVLAVECDEPAAKVLADRLRGALEAAGIRASVGHATRQPTGTLAKAWSAADAEMYAHKRRVARG